MLDLHHWAINCPEVCSFFFFFVTLLFLSLNKSTPKVFTFCGALITVGLQNLQMSSLFLSTQQLFLHGLCRASSA